MSFLLLIIGPLSHGIRQLIGLSNVNAYEVLVVIAGIVLAPLLRRHGFCRIVAVGGSLTGSLGYALSFPASNILHLYVTFGIIAGTATTRTTKHQTSMLHNF